MEKLNLKEKLDQMKFSIFDDKSEQVIKSLFIDFLLPLKQKNLKVEIKNAEEFCKKELERKVDVALHYIDPRAVHPDFYCVLSDNEIKEILSLDKDYVSFEKEVKKIKDLPIHKSMKFDIYHIKLSEQVPYSWVNQINIKVVRESDGADYVIDILRLESDLYYKTQALDHYDCIF